MLNIPCPYCGPRAQVEFTYGGDATLHRPDASAPESEWAAFVYTRANPCGVHEEWWHHAAGCRSWIRVRRDTLTHQILGSASPGFPLPAEAG